MRPSPHSKQSCLSNRVTPVSLPMLEGVGGINLGALGQRMRDRWQTVSRLWETNKATVNRLNLLERLDYHTASCQRNLTGNGIPSAGRCAWCTADLVSRRQRYFNDEAIVDYTYCIGSPARYAGSQLPAGHHQQRYAVQTAVNKFTDDQIGQFGALAIYTSTYGSCPSRSSTPASRYTSRCPRLARRRRRARPSS